MILLSMPGIQIHWRECEGIFHEVVTVNAKSGTAGGMFGMRLSS